MNRRRCPIAASRRARRRFRTVTGRSTSVVRRGTRRRSSEPASIVSSLAATRASSAVARVVIAHASIASVDTLFFDGDDGVLLVENLVVPPAAEKHALALKARSLDAVEAAARSPSTAGRSPSAMKSVEMP